MFLNGLESGCLGIMTFNPQSKEECFTHTAEVLDFLNSKLKQTTTKNVPESFFALKNAVNGFLNRSKRLKQSRSQKMLDSHIWYSLFLSIITKISQRFLWTLLSQRPKYVLQKIVGTVLQRLWLASVREMLEKFWDPMQMQVCQDILVGSKSSYQAIEDSNCFILNLKTAFWQSSWVNLPNPWFIDL